MSTPVLVDTDVLIDFLRGREQAVSFVNRESDRIILPAIVVAELYAGVRGEKGETEQGALERFLSLFRVVHVTAAIARLGGLYKRDYGKSHGISLADAVVAATATVENAQLKTLNVKHYPMFHAIEPAYRSSRKRDHPDAPGKRVHRDSAPAMTAPATGTPRSGAFAVGLRTDRHFKYLIILPAVFILLFIGIFPLVYTLVASVQDITMLEDATHRLVNRDVVDRPGWKARLAAYAREFAES